MHTDRPGCSCLGITTTQCANCSPSHVRSCVYRYADTYGVRLDPSTQALSLIGSQEGLGHLLMAVADPGR